MSATQPAAKAHPMALSPETPSQDPITVDLDRDLLRNPAAVEIFWARLARWPDALRGWVGAGGGAGPLVMNTDLLPLRADTLARLSAAGNAGRILQVASDAHPDLAARVAARLGTGGAGDTAQRFGPGLQAGPMLAALRPHQWLKNLLVFLPMFAAHRLDGETLLRTGLAFLAFCLVASSVYVLNDLIDLSADRTHPRKRRRPFASGSLPIVAGHWIGPLLLMAGAAIAAGLGGEFALLLGSYYVVTLAYSLVLKRLLVIDICVLAGLYTLRIMAGAAATGINLSVWILAFSIFFFFSLAAVKRQAELVDSSGRGELGASGRGYRVGDLPLISQMATASGYVSVLIMALYVNSPQVRELYQKPSALWGICLVLLFWISRMVMVTHRGKMNDDPVVYAAKDPVSLLCVGLIVTSTILGAVLKG
jgi:4-hydroxybenzoate polyprenyltransferase